MSEKIKKIILFLIVFYFSVSGAKAFTGTVCAPIPFCPMPDFINEAASILQGVSNLSNNVQKTITSTSDSVNNLKTAIQSVFSGEISTLVDTVEDTSRPMVNCVYDNQEYRNDDPEDVESLVNYLFLQYPSQDEIIKQKYRENREKFYYDSIVEIHTALRELSNEMDIVSQQIDATIECITVDGSKCGIGKAEANTDALFIEGKAYEAVENLYAMLLKITALKAQFIAVKSLYKLDPAIYVDGISDKMDAPMGSYDGTSSNDKQAFIWETSFSRSDTISFAQIGLGAETSATTSLSQVEAAALVPADEGQKMVGEVMFNLADKPEQQHAFVDAEEKMAELEKIEPLANKVDMAKEIHNLINSLPSYKNAAQSVEDAKKDYQHALENLKLADACARDYIGRHFSNPDAVWYGNSKGLTDYDSRGGISGWALQAYSAAKAVQANNIDEEEIETLDIDYENDVEETEEWDVERDRKLVDKKTKGFNNKSKQEKIEKEQKQANMLSWQIGAEASKMMAATPSQWGNPISERAFPVWQDVKGFYNQYLSKKYANIKDYLKSFSSIDVLSLVADRLSGRNGEINSESIESINNELEASILKADKAQREAIDDYNNQYKNSLSALEFERDKIAGDLENLGKELQKNIDMLTDMREKAHAEVGENMIAEVTHVDEFPDSINDNMPKSKPIAEIKEIDELNQEFKGQAISAKKQSINGLQKIVEEQKQEIINLEAELAAADEALALFKISAQNGGANLQEGTEELKQSLIDKAADLIIKANNTREQEVKGVLMPLLEKKIKENPLLMLTAQAAYNTLRSAAERALSGLYDEAESRVEVAYAQIKALGDGLYDVKNHNKIVEIHQSMINDIKAMSITVDGGLLPAVSGIMVYAKLLSVDAAPEQNDYFVGKPAKERDVKAPKAIFEQNLPPLREIFYFDVADFQQVKPFSAKDKKTSNVLKEDFLNMGGEIPLVWQYMLQRQAFVETDIDLAELLDEGCSQLTFFRHGNMPCKIKDSNVVLDMNEKGEFITISVPSDIMLAVATCPQLIVKKNKIKHVARDVNIDLGSLGNTGKINCAYSELGTLFAADEKNNISFRQPTFDAYFAIWFENSEDNKKVSNKENQELAAYEAAPYSRNQIGDFLVYAEGEQSMRKQQEEAEVNYEDMIKRLIDILKQYGYEVSENLNMADEKDYEAVRKGLKSIKNKLISEVAELSKEIKTENNSVVEERVRSLESVVKAIQKDVDELVVIGDGVDEENDLDERIKTAKVNRDVSGKYMESIGQSADASRADSPYCALY